MALSVWKRSSHADEFHDLASHVLYCTPLNLIIAKRNVAYYMLLCRGMCSIETDQSMTWWLLLRVERGRGVCVCGGGEVAIIYRLASSRCLE